MCAPHSAYTRRQGILNLDTQLFNFNFNYQHTTQYWFLVWGFCMACKVNFPTTYRKPLWVPSSLVESERKNPKTKNQYSFHNESLKSRYHTMFGLWRMYSYNNYTLDECTYHCITLLQRTSIMVKKPKHVGATNWENIYIICAFCWFSLVIILQCTA